MGGERGVRGDERVEREREGTCWEGEQVRGKD